MRLFFLLLLLALAAPGRAQPSPQNRISPSVIFQQRVGVRAYAGKAYRLQVRLRVLAANLYADITAIDARLLQQIRRDKKMLTLVSPFSARFRKLRLLVNILLKYPRMTFAELKKITAPTLVLTGEKDVIKEPHTRLIAAGIPGAQLVIFPGLSHYAQQESPALFNETVLRFLLAP